VNDLSLREVVHLLEVRNLEVAYRLDRGVERRVRIALAPLLSQILSRGSKDTQDLRPVEPLSFTMLAEAHGRLSPR
jgi:hypothetical protein